MDSFDLMECIDEGLDQFGSNLRYLVYWRMTVLNDLPRGGILANPDAFVRGLESIYGAAARQVEIAIVNKISERSGTQFLPSSRLSEVIHSVMRQAQTVEVMCDFVRA